MLPKWTGKPGKWENTFQSGKSGGILNRLENVGEFYPKYWKSEGNLASFYFQFFSNFF